MNHGAVMPRSGLVMALDAANPKSFTGEPTTNLIAGNNPGVYNNLSGNISSTITATSETFKGATVFRQVITPLDATGVANSSAGANSGLGVYHTFGSVAAATYAGASIFFKPMFPLHSTPIFTHYANVGNWDGQHKYEYLGDGWYRAWATVMNPAGFNDAKYWAINPATSAIGQSMVCYWAGPFKEVQSHNALNRVSLYTPSTRSGATFIDLSDNSNHGTLNNGVTHTTANKGAIILSGAQSVITAGPNLTSSDFTVVGASRYTNAGAGGRVITAYANNWLLGHWSTAGTEQLYSEGWVSYATGTLDTNWRIYHATGNIAGDVYALYVNGIQIASNNAGSAGPNRFSLGAYGGGSEFSNSEIGFVYAYNRVLTNTEIAQSFAAMRGRYGL